MELSFHLVCVWEGKLLVDGWTEMGELELSLVSDNSLDWPVSVSFCFLDFLCSSERPPDL